MDCNDFARTRSFGYCNYLYEVKQCKKHQFTYRSPSRHVLTGVLWNFVPRGECW